MSDTRLSDTRLSDTRIRGRVWKFGDNISADDGIIQYSKVPDLATFDIPALKAMCFAELQPSFCLEVKPGDVVVAGANFGHHSHAHACVAMKESGIAVVVVESCDSVFIRKALNVGLPIVVCPGITRIVDQGEELEVDLSTGEVHQTDTGATLHARPFSDRMIEVWRAGSLTAAMRQRLAGRASGA
jgi:3-isopropylmalate/(R)-2-methylmalate dehydratase small subunit